ncbi:hypothetical protein BDV59DRAFT_187495 [Aspergillus ambiguus]|uniref:uncharacterized protein n=1 Tax=Aspergillus ambiguus TaxID=176160 RepID=UPI003CCCBF21
MDVQTSRCPGCPVHSRSPLCPMSRSRLKTRGSHPPASTVRSRGESPRAPLGIPYQSPRQSIWWPICSFGSVQNSRHSRRWERKATGRHG